MIWQFDLLNDNELKILNKHYVENNFESGNRSNPDTNLKKNLQMKNIPVYEDMCKFMWSKLKSSEKMNTVYLMKNMSQVYYAWYKEGDKYDWHMDNFPCAGVTSDMSMTIFLNEPDEYDGGELVIKVGDIETPHKLKAGQAILYNAGLWHKVNPITRGERRVAVCWIENTVQNSFMRTQLIDLGHWMYELKPEQIEWYTRQRLDQFRINFIREYGRP